MPRSIIERSVILPAPADVLFDMYLDPQLHAAFAGQPVTISREPHSEFGAFGGLLSGSVLAVIPPSLIVLSWRSVNFLPEDPDSTLILAFTSLGDEGRINLIHLDVPKQDLEGVTIGWEKYYWTPLKEYLEREATPGQQLPGPRQPPS